MLVVKVELWPHGDMRKSKTLGVATIHNDLTSGSHEKGNYGVTMTEVGEIYLGIKPREETFEIKDHPRRQSVWNLVAEALMHWQNPDMS